MSDLLKLAGVGVLALGLIGSSGGAPRKPDGTIDPAAAVAKGWDTTTGGLSAEGTGSALGTGLGSAVDSGASQISNSNLGRGVLAGGGLIVAGGVAAGVARGLGNMGRPVGEGIKGRIKNGPTIVEPQTPVTAAPSPTSAPPVTAAPTPATVPPPPPWPPVKITPSQAFDDLDDLVEDSPWAFCPQPIGVKITC